MGDHRRKVRVVWKVYGERLAEMSFQMLAICWVVGCYRAGCMRRCGGTADFPSGVVNCGRGLRAGFIEKESRREEWPLQSVFTLHVTDLQQRLTSRAGVCRI